MPAVGTPGGCKYRTIGYVVGPGSESKVNCLRSFYSVINMEDNPAANIDLLVVVGGDGLMLHGLHNHVITPRRNVPVYGVRAGTVGFLLNSCPEGSLPCKIEDSVATDLTLLHMEATDIRGTTHQAIAVNEVSLFRRTHQAVKLQIKLDGKLVMHELVSDGIIVASPAGSTAYNFSAGGPILPFNSNVIALTSVNSFRPRRWRGALLPHSVEVEIEVLAPEVRTVSAVADYTEFSDIKNIKIRQDSGRKVTLMFDPEHRLEERTIAEQFVV